MATGVVQAMEVPAILVQTTDKAANMAVQATELAAKLAVQAT